MARVLLTGATGFIGRKLYDSLVQQGHDVVVTSSSVESPQTLVAGQNIIKADFASPSSWDVDFWKKIITEHQIEYVINNSGIISESESAPFDAVNFKAPKALAEACAGKGNNFKGFIQISSVCTELSNYQKFGYSASKRKTDDYLQALHTSHGLPIAIIRTNVVFSEEGFGHKGSFDDLSQLIPIPIGGEGTAIFQPIHVDDLAKITNLVGMDSMRDGSTPTILHAVGPHEISCHDLLQLRRPQDSAYLHIHMPYADLHTLAERFPYGIAGGMTAGMLEDQEKNPFQKYDFSPFCDACGIAPDSLQSIHTLPPQPKRNFNVTSTVMGAMITDPANAVGPLLHAVSRIPSGETRLEWKGSEKIEGLRKSNEDLRKGNQGSIER